MQYVEDFLKKNGIEYKIHEHPPVFTCEEADKHCGHLPGLSCKNLFLRNKKGDRHILVILPAAKRADLKWIAEIIGDTKPSFASPDRLMEKLHLTPGSVSPFGLINDTKNEVEVIVDKEVHDADIMTFHPNRNDASLELTKAEFQKYLEIIGNNIRVIQI